MPTKPASRACKEKAAPLVFTEQGQKVFDAWCSLYKSRPKAAEKTIDCANNLYDRLVPWCQEWQVSCRDVLREIRAWLYTADPDWYRKKGVTLCDIDAKFEAWQSVKTEAMERGNILSFPEAARKPLSIDEQIAASERAMKEFEARERAAKERRLAANE